MAHSDSGSSWWHDSADIDELVALENGAVGVTTNPVLVRQTFTINLSFGDLLADLPKELKVMRKQPKLSEGLLLK